MSLQRCGSLGTQTIPQCAAEQGMFPLLTPSVPEASFPLSKQTLHSRFSKVAFG